MKKRILALMMVFTIAASTLVGCGGGSSGGGSADKGSGGTSSGSSEGKTKLTALFVSHPLTKSVEEMEWVQDLEEEHNIEIEWEQIYSDWDTVKSTRFASGDIPDLLFNSTSPADYITYNGLFEDLTDLIEAHAPNIQKMFEEEPDTRILSETLEGKIFSTPKFQGKWPETNTVMFINQTWLDNLDLPMPGTFTELQAVLQEFKAQDANGNGDPNDEIPMDFDGWFGAAYSLTNLIGSLGIQLTNWAPDGYFAEDSTVKNFAIDERYKLLMKYVADLYSDGLINENAITDDYSAFQSLSRGDENGDALVGVVFGWEETDKFGPDLHEEYVPLAPLEYDIDTEPGTYDVRWRDDFTGLNMSSDRVAMSAQCKDKEVAMKFIDAFYDNDRSVEVLFGGIVDGCLEKTGDNQFKVLPPQDPDVDPGTWKWTNSFADDGPMYIRQATEIEMSQDMMYALEEREVYKDAIAKADETDSYPQMFMKYTEEEQNTLAIAQANINNITDNFWSVWLTGESDIDSDWDAYVSSIEAAGLEEVLEIRQKAFDNYLNQ